MPHAPTTDLDSLPIPFGWFQVGWPSDLTVGSVHPLQYFGRHLVPCIDDFEADGPILRMRSTQRWPTPQGVVDAFVEATNYGPGFSVARMTGIIDTISLGYNTPVSEDRCHLRFTFTVKELGDPAMTALVGDGFISILSQQIGEDVRIWEDKTYLSRPALSDGDGPIMAFRSWAHQFYAPSA